MKWKDLLSFSDVDADKLWLFGVAGCTRAADVLYGDDRFAIS